MPWYDPGMSFLRCLLLVFLASCSGQLAPGLAPPVDQHPDWVEINGMKQEAIVVSVPTDKIAIGYPRDTRSAHLLVFPYPQVSRFPVDASGAWDVVFFDIGGRVIDVFPVNSCVFPCLWLDPRFPAASVLVAPKGYVEQARVSRHNQMRWGKRRSLPVRTFPLID